MSFLDAMGHLSFILTACSFALRDMLLLRSLSIASGAVGIYYNYSLPGGPLWLVIFWLCVFMAINLAQIALLVLARRAVALSDEEQELLETVFIGLSPVEMMKLTRAATWRSVQPGEVLTREGEAVEDLVMLSSGEVQVLRGGAEVDRARDGTLIGEMSFIGRGAAKATVTVTRPSRLLCWKQDALRRLLQANPSIQLSLHQVFSTDLIAKVTARDAS